jgi:hypothetical protein
LPDIFLSYSSKDRSVAERIQARLAEEGYDVFWDQSTPPGIDWDTWIRGQLCASRCVVVLWSKTSVSSPNVRHEAMIGRDRGNLLPVMIDELDPTDFPIGLFMVQALTIGRTRKSLAANWGKLLEEVRAKVQAGSADEEATPAEARPDPKPRTRRLWRRPRVIAAALGALLVLFLLLQLGSILTVFDASRPPVPAALVESARDGEKMARARVVRTAEEAVTSNREAVGTNWVWLAAQQISSAPEEARRIAPDFFRYLARVERPDCGCFHTEGIPHTAGNAWVVVVYAHYRQPVPPLLLRTILDAQAPDGWWPISLSATAEPANASTHATAIVTLALARAREAGVVPAELRAAVDAALGRGVTWLNRGPEDGGAWTDYPNNERRTENIIFAAMATVASAAAGEPDGRAARAFRRSVSEIPAPTASFGSNSYVELSDGTQFIDQYRHGPAPWIGAAAVIVYERGGLLERRTLRHIIREWLSADIADERLLRQDWLTGETLFMRSLAFPLLTEADG